MEKNSKEIVIDRLALSKNEILEFCDNVLNKWKEDPNQSQSNIVAMTAVRTSVYWTDEDSLKAIWAEILKWTFELMYKNAIALAKEENLEWSTILQKMEKKENPKTSESGTWY